MANLKIELVKSLNGRLEKHIATAESLGLRKIGQSTIQPDNTQTRGKIAFLGHKCTLTDWRIGVMLILRGPGDLRGGHVIDGMVSQIVGKMSICELLGIERPPWLQGRSLLPLIRGEVEEINEEIFAGVTYHAAYEPQRAVRTHRWKYIRRYVEQSTPVLPNCDDGSSKEEWLAHGWAGRTLA